MREICSQRHNARVAILVCVALTAACFASLGLAVETNVTDANDPNKTLTITNVKSNADDSRTAERWGHIELIGSGTEYEFIKALFGGPLVCKPQPLVLADPIDACNNIQNRDIKGKILYAKRGGCTFSDKAWFAQNAGAAGLIIANSDQSIIRMPEGYHTVSSEEAEKSPIEIPVVMVRQTAGSAIEKIARRFDGVIPSVVIVAKQWTNQGTFLSGPCRDVFHASDGKAVVRDDDDDDANNDARSVKVISDVETLSSDGGILHLVPKAKGRSFEYLRGRFGGPPPQNPVPFVVADPIDACSSQTRRVKKSAKGAALIVRRGTCPFSDKSKIAEDLGASVLVVINVEGRVMQEMSNGDLEEDVATLFPIMITHASGEALLASIQGSKRAIHGRMSASNFALGSLWGTLERIQSLRPAQWGPTLEDRLETYGKLRAMHDPKSESGTGSAERMEFLEKIYASLPPLPRGEL